MRVLRRVLMLCVLYFPPLFVLLLVLGALYESGHPWPPAQAALQTSVPMASFLVGFRVNDRCSWDSRGKQCSHFAARTYLVIPKEAGSPKLVTVAQKNAQAPEVSEQGAGQFLLAIGALIAMCAIAWPLWLRRGRPNAA